MTNLRSTSLSGLACAALCCAALFASVSSPAQGTAPSVRIVNQIDEGQLVTLKGNTHPAANAANDRGAVSPDLPMTDLILVLSRSPERQAAFDAYVAGEYDQNSPNFHHWLTPDEIGAQFGPAPADIATISNWLAGHGFTVSEVTKDNMTIRFSGTAGQVQSAFHTQIHNLSVKGAAHIGNMSDPQIPAAFAPVIVGVKALHNFFPKPLHHMGGTVQRDAATGKWQRLTSTSSAASTPGSTALASRSIAAARPATASPQYGISVGGSSPYLVEDLDPWDFATIYNILPLWNAGTPIDGTGQTIAIAGTSDIDVGQSAASETGANGNNDVLTFRTYFGLPTSNPANTPKRVSGNSQPLTVCSSTTNALCSIGDLTENSLDVEWSGSIAKNAQIVLVSSYPASSSDDNLYDSESYIVNNINNASSPVFGAHIMNVSYGECELGNGTAGNVEYYDLWQQAAAEGISVFVASGDSGADSCDQGNAISPVAESGLSVSGLASTPWNTAVGGTDFNWCLPDKANGSATNTECTAVPYWSTSPITSPGSTQAVTTALGYVPETPWNETCANPLTLSWVQDVANVLYKIPSSGPNGITSTEQACNFLWDFDFTGYQNGYYGLYNGPGTNYPNYPGYPYVLNLLQAVGGSGGASSCVVGSAVQNNNTGALSGCTASTGAGTTGTTINPDTNGSQASLPTYNNGWPKPSWQISAESLGVPADGVRDLPDVSFFAADGYTSSSAYLICVSAVDSNNAPCTYSTYTEPFYQEVGGTSVATPAMAGVMALINQKTGVAQGLATPELYKLAASQTYSSCSAESVTAGSTTCMFNDIDTDNNAAPCDEGSFIATYDSPNCIATQSTIGFPDNSQGLGILSGYSAGTGYDLATGLGSLNVANVVDHWVSLIGSGATTITVTPSPNPVSSAASVSVTVTVGSTPSGGTTPTGSVTLSGGGYTSSPETLVSGGTDTTSSYAFTIPAGTLAGGTDTLTAAYSGDPNYASATGNNTVTVNKLSAAVSATPTPASVNSNQQVVINGTVACSTSCTGSVTPTGTVTVSYGSYTSSAATLSSSGAYSVTITPNSLTGATPAQTDVLTVNYSGDANYSAASTTTSVLVAYFQVLTPTIAILPTSTTVNSGASLLVTVSLSGPVATPPNPVPTGTVTLTGSGYTSTPQLLSNGSYAFTIPANTLSPVPSLPAGDPITASYQGDSNYAQVSKTTRLTVNESVFSPVATGPSSPVPPGTAASATVAVSSTSNYTGTATFTSASCVLTGYPAGVTSSTPDNPTCTLSGNGTVTFAANGTITGSPVTFAIHTYSATNLSELRRPVIGHSAPATQLAKIAAPANRHAPVSRGTELFGAAGSAALAGLLLFFIPGGARKWSKMLGAILLIVALTFAIEGCGGGGSGNPTPPPTLPTPTVTVTPPTTAPTFNAPFNVTVAVAGSAGTPTGGVTLSGGALAGQNATLTNGSATFTIPAGTFAGGASVTLTASYQGNTAYNPNSGTASINVDYVPTTAGTYTFTVTPTSNPSIAASTTFTVTVM